MSGPDGDDFLASLTDTSLYSIGAYFADRHPDLVDDVIAQAQEIEDTGIERYADDEVNRFVPGWSSTGHCAEVLEVAGAEAPVSAHVTQADDASPRG